MARYSDDLTTGAAFAPFESCEVSGAVDPARRVGAGQATERTQPAVEPPVAPAGSIRPSASPDPRARLLRPGETCRSVCRAHRFSVLIDAEAYFAAVRAAIVRARRSVTIVGWDIDSRVQLVPAGAHDGYPARLGEFLAAVAAERPALEIRVLAWDFAMLYALEREWLPSYRAGWRSGRRLRFMLDGRHPPGASHHQKIVVVDDALAFVGGIDLTRSRWDTPEHAPEQPLRCNGPRRPYAPTHDVQAMFDGEAAGAIGELVRERWNVARGPRRGDAADDVAPATVAPVAAAPVAVPTDPPRPAPDPNAAGSAGACFDPWPPEVPVDLEDVALGIALTAAPYPGCTPCQQIQALYLAALAAARRTVYIENQYFTASAFGEALARRLAEPDGPTVAAVVPREQTGWLQATTMGTLRARLYRRLRAADPAGRLRLYAPAIEGLRDGAFINVHSKLMTVDDELLIIGSANLNNRSMVLDSECNVALEAAGDARVRAAIAAVRNRLLAEHLGTRPEAVAQALADGDGDLHRAIGACAGGPRTLEVLEPSVSRELDRLVPESALVDPERPAVPDEVVREFVPGPGGRSITARLLLLGVCALLAVAMTLAWHYTPLAQYVSFARIGRAAHTLAATRCGPLLVVGAYALAAICSVPVTVLIACAGLLFGALAGSLYALAGSLLAALATYGIGRWAGRDAVRRRAGSRLNRLSKRLGRQGVVAVVVLRIAPLAPFVLVNLAAGASHIRLRDYLIGTLVGMAPGIVLATTFAHQLVAAVQRPGAGSLAVLAAIGVALVALSLALQRFLGTRP